MTMLTACAACGEVTPWWVYHLCPKNAAQVTNTRIFTQSDIDAAVAAERERCAKMCDLANSAMTAQDCADEIRSGDKIEELTQPAPLALWR